MSPVLYVGAFLVTLFVCKIIHRWLFREEKLKDFPGPKGWPLVGNSLQLDPVNPHKTFLDWSRKYGDIFKIKIFQEDTVVLNDYESMLEMFNSEACSARPYIYRVSEIIFKGHKDIGLQSFSAEWNERKKALTRSLNAYGAGSMKIEKISLECIDKLFEQLVHDTDNFSKSIDLRPYIYMCIAGILTTLFYGRRLEESELLELLALERGLMKLASPAGLIAVIDYLPWMRHLPFKNIQGPIKESESFHRWILEKQNESENYLPKNENCILDSMREHLNEITSELIKPEELAAMTINIIGGGFSTSTAILYSLFLVLINHPGIQDKMHEEIQHVTNGAKPTVSDQSRMPYIRAVIEEILRYATVFPLAVPHYSGEDTTISGKHLPKGTVLLANIWGLHHDERYFDEPWKFKPERYLKEDGQIVSGDDAVSKHSMPFGAGRRICPGEGLARKRLFLIIASLLQKFKFLPEDDHDIPSSDPRLFDSGIVVTPFEYKVKIMER